MYKEKLSHAPFVLFHNADAYACGQYRIIQVAEALHAAGKANCRVTNRLLTKEGISMMKPDLVVVQRQYLDDQIKALKQYKEAGCRIIYDLDDAVHKTPAWSPHANQTPPDFLKRIRKLSPYISLFTVSTQALADELKPHTKNTPFVVRPNYLPEQWRFVSRSPRDVSAKLKIGFTGGIAHKGDLDELLPVMKALGDEVEWVFMCQIPDFNPEGIKISYVEPVPYDQYPSTLASMDVDIMVAPLQKSVFNKCKSDLRIKECGACAFPVIASNFGPYTGFPHVYHASTAEEWEAHIRYAMAEREAIKEEGLRLQEHIRNNHILTDHLDEILGIYDLKREVIPEATEDCVSVIVPCYKNVPLTKRCLESVIKTIPKNKTPMKLIVINDASPEPAMPGVLNAFKKNHPEVVLINHDKNKGYVKSVNHGIWESDGDIVTLNSDAEVYGDWVDRLRKAGGIHESIASVTPLASEGSIATFKSVTGKEKEEIDEAAATTNANMWTPTSIGFCTYFKRNALIECGLFDENGYGKGYGEENDWSLWALERKLHHTITSSVYVTHEGSASFGDSLNLQKIGQTKVMMRYPKYREILENLFAHDPMKAVKEPVEVELLKTQKSRLFVSHTFGGGMETHVQDVVEDMSAEDVSCHILRNEGPKGARLHSSTEPYTNIRPFDLTNMDDLNRFVSICKVWNMDSIQLHTTYGYDNTFPNWLRLATQKADIPYDIMLHDYISICPQIFLLKKDGNPQYNNRYCAIPDESECENCIAHGSAFGIVDISSHRHTYKKLLENARNLFAPSDSCADPIKEILELQHPVYIRPHKTQIGKPLNTQGNNIAILGNIGSHKGSSILNQVAKAQPEKLFILIGNASPDIEKLPNLIMFGPYGSKDELKQKVQFSGSRIAFLPSTFPETHMYTLTEAYECGLWPVVFDLGHSASRIKATGIGTVLPIEWMYGDHSKEILEVLDELLEQDLPLIDPDQINVNYDSALSYYSSEDNNESN